ncbi:hypothetical protein LV457_05290 [Mycobacterium sp. MYCO198283]|uniref:hypothetical protein n=1 Tax=Mycobacterium sp. MYCO198283 TaxID=2883505 RepID=UPI001E32507F|nr:hypothetical protein [Mycobacterium sp. MYCO198283]MCG5431706.1 hypothetical protein [Mycobacterium sp. MYCO198283]
MFAGAGLGGAMWAVVVRLTVFSPSPPSTGTARLVIGAGCLVMLVVGVAMMTLGRRTLLRSAGVVLSIAPLTGGLLIGLGALLTAIGSLWQ